MRRTAAALLGYATLVGYAAVVVGASVSAPPAGGLPPTGPLELVGADKWLHAAAYLTMSLLAAATLGRRATAVVAFAVAAGFGGGVELVQATLPQRAFDPLDAVANAVGAALGAACWAAYVRVAGGEGGS